MKIADIALSVPFPVAARYCGLLAWAALSGGAKGDAPASTADMLVSVGPAGFNVPYTAAAASEIMRGVDSRAHWSGASTGAIVACFACCGMDPVEPVKDFCALTARAGGDPRKLVESGRAFLSDRLPSDAHERCSGRLTIGYTGIAYNPLAEVVALCVAACALWSARRHLSTATALVVCVTVALPFVACTVRPGTVSSYKTRDDLLDAISASMSIPGIQDGVFRRGPQKGAWCVDGALTQRHNYSGADEGKCAVFVDTFGSAGPTTCCPLVPLPSRLTSPHPPDKVKELTDAGARDARGHMVLHGLMRP